MKIKDCVAYQTNDKLVIDKLARKWCQLPYPDHPYGCPNYYKNSNCPPRIGMVYNIFDLSEPHFFIAAKFNIAEQEMRMKKRHPEWSEKQCRCCLYWQGKVRKQLKKACEYFKSITDIRMSYTLIPEAMGVDVFETMKRFSIILKKNPRSIVYKIALMGFRRGESNDFEG